MVDVNRDESINKVTNKLSIIYMFPGDPSHPISRKRMNDIRINALRKRNIIGRDALSIAREVTSFREAISDKFMRRVFWSCYEQGTGNFSISMSNLDQLTNVDDWCPICIGEFSDMFPGIRLQPCQHIFHPRCIQELILNIGDLDMTCPTCRGIVVSLG